MAGQGREGNRSQSAERPKGTVFRYALSALRHAKMDCLVIIFQVEMLASKRQTIRQTIRKKNLIKARIAVFEPR